MKPVLSDLSHVFFHRSTKTMMMSSLYKTVSFFRPPSRRPDRSAGVTVRRRSVWRRRSVRRRSVRRRRPGRRADRTAGGPDGGRSGRRPGGTAAGGLAGVGKKRPCANRDPPSDMFYGRARWKPGTRHPPLLSPPSSPDPPPPTTLRALPLCFLTPRSCTPTPAPFQRGKN
jgi:hypothetical protein